MICHSMTASVGLVTPVASLSNAVIDFVKKFVKVPMVSNSTAEQKELITFVLVNFRELSHCFPH